MTKDELSMAKNDLKEIVNMIDPNHNIFHQAVKDVSESIEKIYDAEPIYKKCRVFDRLFHHDRIIKFRVTWEDDNSDVHHNFGWRVQHNNALGAYKGGLRFHPNVNEDTFKFLSFEQTFKNTLTGLPMGGAKGGSDFNPKGKSDREIMRFCQAFMRELAPFIGPETDVPAGDIGVGAREIGYLYGTYKAITEKHNGVLTGKAPLYGGSLIRTEATGYGAAYFLSHVLNNDDKDIKNLRVAISGAGNVSLHLAEKIIDMNGTVVSLSDSNGTLMSKDGFTIDDLKAIKSLKLDHRDRLKNYKKYDINGDYHDDKEPWSLCDYDIAAPSATQNEIDDKDTKGIIKSGASYVLEAANMPLTHKATLTCIEKGLIILPAKAVNAGGVAVSGIERTQNALMEQWSAEKVDTKLQNIMKDIYQSCVLHAPNCDGADKYIHGANIAGFRKVANAIIAQGGLN